MSRPINRNKLYEISVMGNTHSGIPLQKGEKNMVSMRNFIKTRTAQDEHLPPNRGM
jgi:hypothetical protein